MSIQVTNLSKVYGSQRAVDGISFSLKKGEIVGFLGPNGAGKSTTMKILTGYLKPSDGIAKVSDYDVVSQPMPARRSIGYLPEHNPLYLDMYVTELLLFSGKLYGMHGAALNARVEEVVAMCGLEAEKRKKIGQLSKGYRQRVGLAQSFLHDPQVLILDEPTTGLDPNQLQEIREVIRTAGQDKTVLFSTHIMQEVEALCDRVIIINKGKVVNDSSLEALRQSGSSLEETFRNLTQTTGNH
ncbi:ATP-binding cassette domain-containing protein [Dyadobacter sp. Leaf189]|uniref:ATP-binding cassette domain-containing protein n=1 Tax=Dyadobacter sp. Leaf189 TaxID=1736295 RepID=UPI0006F624D1|nr:ATP-binding cassette domain-containing protein [Dyadobacter sp. Leaf189]KQS32887.1 multidrug ABC transporter ATP-binding protein [Dyadobacter sp. Leaf189]